MNRVLGELDAGDTPCITVFNKADRMPADQRLPSVGGAVCAISARTGDGIDLLVRQIGTLLAAQQEKLAISIPVGRADLMAALHRAGRVVEEVLEGGAGELPGYRLRAAGGGRADPQGACPDVLTFPNFLTLLRIAAIPVFLAVLAQHNYAAAFILLVCAGITDVIDGCVARVNDSSSELGAVLDPIADKLLLLSAFLVLGIAGHVPAWLVAFVIMRDIIIVAGYISIFVVDQEWVEIDPSGLGKLTTFVQLFTVGFALVAEARPDLPLLWFNYAMQSLTALASAASGVQYVYRGLLWHQRHGNVAG